MNPFIMEFFFDFDSMNPTTRFWKLVLLTLFVTLAVTAGIIFFFWQGLTTEQSHNLVSILMDHSIYIISIVLLLTGVVFTGLEIIFICYIKPLKKISSEASMIYSSNPSHRLAITGNKDIKNLSSAINDFADMFENLNKDITHQILLARKETEKERNLLAAIMAELPQGVIICNLNGRILLYNFLAQKIFTQKNSASTEEYFIGLGRSIFHLFDKALIAHALEEIQESLNNQKQNAASYFITPIYTGCLIWVETIPVLDQEHEMTGFILTFKDVTDKINQYDAIHEKLVSFQKELSKQIAIFKHPLSKTKTKQKIKPLDDLNEQYRQLLDIVQDSLLTKLPLTKLSVLDFLYSMKEKLDSMHGIQLNISASTEKNRILADAYSLTSALVSLFKELSDICRIKQFHLFSFKQDKSVIIEITWEKNPAPKSIIDKLLSKQTNTLPSLFYVLKQNRAVIKPVYDSQAQCSQINIITRAQLETDFEKPRRLPVVKDSRPEFYDFDMFSIEEKNRSLLNTGLKNIMYTVFDTETTGLNPGGGDEIISIAGVRIVNGKIMYNDIFEELVDPKRDIPMESYRIHGINYEMVAGKKDINTVLPAFKNFASNTVLVGHNIAFDMKMFKIKEKSTNIKFQNHVLDTLLLSAALHPMHEQHDMENIAKRLGVDILGRHTALGDAIAAAQIFLKLIPVLNSNGILTLKDTIAVSQKTYYARLKY